jgi:multicomponent Na+:H+ antiporter subunit F
VNQWLMAALVLVTGLVPCGIVCLRASVMEALVALELAGVLVMLVLLLVAEGLHRQPFADLALVQALLSFAGGLAFARFLERWL